MAFAAFSVLAAFFAFVAVSEPCAFPDPCRKSVPEFQACAVSVPENVDTARGTATAEFQACAVSLTGGEPRDQPVCAASFKHELCRCPCRVICRRFGHGRLCYVPQSVIVSSPAAVSACEGCHLLCVMLLSVPVISVDIFGW